VRMVAWCPISFAFGAKGPPLFPFLVPQTGFYAVVLRSFAVNYSLIVLELLISRALKIKAVASHRRFGLLRSSFPSALQTSAFQVGILGPHGEAGKPFQRIRM
jgi:hypothetical protein